MSRPKALPNAQASPRRVLSLRAPTRSRKPPRASPTDDAQDASTVLSAVRQALARGNVEFIRYELNELLQLFRINLDPRCPDYRKLALAVMRAEVRALENVLARNRGEPIESPPASELPPGRHRPSLCPVQAVPREPMPNGSAVRLSLPIAPSPRERPRAQGKPEIELAIGEATAAAATLLCRAMEDYRRSDVALRRTARTTATQPVPMSACRNCGRTSRRSCRKRCRRNPV